MKAKNTFLVIGDVHLSRKHFNRSKALVQKLIEAENKHQPTCGTVLLGDTLDRFDLEAEALALFGDIVQGMKGDVYALVGNHEMPSSRVYLPQYHGHTLARILSHPRLHIIDNPTARSIEGLGNIAYLPFVPNGRFREAYDCVMECSPLVVFCHQEFKGCRMDGSAMSTHGDDPLEGINIISGHIHGEQQLGNIWYPGTPCQHHFGEDDNKYIYLIEVTPDGNYEVLEKIDLGMPTFVTHHTDVDGAMNVHLTEGPSHKVVITDQAAKLLAFKASKGYYFLKCRAVVSFKPQKQVIENKESFGKGFKQLLKEYAEKEGVSDELEALFK